MKLKQLTTKIQVKFDQFSQKNTKGFSLPQQKFMRQIQFGILKSGKVQLNDIGRALQENIALKKTTKRLGQHLGIAGLWQQIMDASLRTQRSYLQHVIRHNLPTTTDILNQPPKPTFHTNHLEK